MGLKSTLAALVLAVPLGLAHPHGQPEPVYAHNAMLPQERSLDHCSGHFEHPEFVKRATDRHVEEFAKLRRKRGLEENPKVYARQVKTTPQQALNTNHRTDKKVSKDMDPKTLFADSGACMLMPQVTEGPLYVKGEQVRQDITDGVKGVPMTTVIQVVDASTCKPVGGEGAYVDLWSSNTTGIYTGVQGYPGMGDPNDSSILKLTALRGVQPIDADGIAVFHGLVPGHYSGRATHIHTIVYLGATKQANNTITGGRAAFIGQLYFDQSLLKEVEATAPYSTNRQPVTQNSADFLFTQGASGNDPVVRYSLVGDKLEDGLFAWIKFGITPARSAPVNPAAFWTDKGGIMNPTGPVAQMNGGLPGGGGFKMPGGGFKMPGAMPGVPRNEQEEQ